MTEPEVPKDANDDERDPDETESAGRTAGLDPTRGKRRRKKLQGWLEGEDDLLTGSTQLMSGARPASFEHHTVFRGARLTARGGPAKEVIDLLRDLVAAVQAIMPTAEPGLAYVGAGNSIEVTLYASDREVAEALARVSEPDGATGPDETPELEPPWPTVGDREDDEHDDGHTVEVASLPDTSLALVVLGEILRYEDPEDAASAARRISVGAADGLRDLALTLADRDVELEVAIGEDQVVAPPDWSLAVVEQLDAKREEPKVSVKVTGFLRGANARGDGEFEIESDRNLPLDSRLGSRMRPGDVVKGTLSRHAVRQIRAGNLWNSQVEGTVEVTRTRKGRSLRVEGRRLTSVRAAPRKGR
jgi:hypothetical protein